MLAVSAGGAHVEGEGEDFAGGGGVNVISPTGKVLGRIQFPLGVSNMAWGEDLHSLFAVGTGGGVYRIRTIVAGQEPMYYRK